MLSQNVKIIKAGLRTSKLCVYLSLKWEAPPRTSYLQLSV